MKRIACTIVSANYLHFGWSLAESFLKFHPENEFHLLLVDQLPKGFVSRDPRVHILEVEKLGLPSFQSLAFKFDILELNTGVKPSFLKYLFGLGANKVIYFDPDIYIYHSVEIIYLALENASIVITPHALSPTTDVEHVYERDFLGTGSFNLGFIAVANSLQGHRFLDWWEERCLNFGFQDLRAGLFVDQKWINLVPCFFDQVHILRDVGCNVAYWNLHERTLSRTDDGFFVGAKSPLIFFHYSGYDPNYPERLSKKLRVPTDVTDTVKQLMEDFCDRLRVNGADVYQKCVYAYANFSNGSLIPLLARRLYSATLDRWGDQNPFDVSGPFWVAAKKAGILSKRDQSGQYSSNNLETDDVRVRMVNRLLFILPKIIGGNRYTMLMKYLSFISILRNQRQLLLTDESQSSRQFP